MPINSLCLIPETSCGRMCPNCYEQKKIYGPELSLAEYVSFVQRNMDQLPSLMEVLIDYNGRESKESMNQILSIIPVKMPVYITLTPQSMMNVVGFDRKVEFRLSLHDKNDTVLAAELAEHFDIDCYSVMIDDVTKLSLPLLKGAPLYLLFDKFSEMWKKLGLDLFNKFLEACNGLSNLTMDHCLQTRSLNHECPADSQINLYRDGSIRRCPYQPVEPPDADYSKGCYLIRS